MVIDLRSGFTLIELSIVLVIIGLIVGGILVGQDLIHAAEIQATISQIGKYNSAVNTFKGKYGGIPGDLDYQTACALGFFCPTSQAAGGLGGMPGFGNGNGILDTSEIAFIGCSEEPAMFWRHLSDAGLVDGSYGSAGPNALDPGSAGASGVLTNLSQFVPQAKLGGNISILAVGVDSINGKTIPLNNYYWLVQVDSINSIAFDYDCYTSPGAKGLTPMDSYNIDTKLDDGLPNTGTVRAVTTAPRSSSPLTVDYPSGDNPPVAGSCIISNVFPPSLTAPYNIDPNTGGTSPACGLLLQFN